MRHDTYSRMIAKRLSRSASYYIYQVVNVAIKVLRSQDESALAYQLLNKRLFCSISIRLHLEVSLIVI